MAEARASELAALLRQLRTRVLERWLERMHGTRWADLPDEEILDHKPSIYDALVELLERREGARAALNDLARLHAEHRDDLGFELTELITETSWFRALLHQEALRATSEPWDEEWVRVDEALDDTQRVSADVFLARRDARTQHVRAQAETFRAQYEEALAAMTDGYFRVDESFRFVFVNPAGERMLGRTNAELQGRTIWEAIGGSAETEIGHLYRKALEDQQPFETTTRFEPWDRWFEVRAFPGPRGISVYFRDITERLERERERERTLEALERGDAVFIVDAEWRIVYVNATQERLARRPRATSLGRVLWEAYPDVAGEDSRFWVEYHRAMRERVPVTFDEYFASAGIWTGVTAYPTQEGGLVAFFRDVTDRKRAEQAQERIFGVVGHDLRNPLTAIRLGIHRVASLQGLPERARAPLDRTLRSADRMERMIDALLDYTRAHVGGGIAVTRVPGDLRQVLGSVEEEFSVSAPGRVLCDVEGDLHGNWDADRLAQVLTNLVTNALKHGDAGRPVTIRGESRNGEITVAVHNAGTPIPRELMGRLFEPFVHGSDGSAGLGLGLYISRNIVEQHGGRIDVASDASGTTFTVSLPRA